jgi:DNA gyrase/topoisomerase IV subunit A
MLQSDESVIQIFNGLETESHVFFITKKGLAKKTPYEPISNLSKNAGATVMKLMDNDEIILCKLLESEKIAVVYNGKEKVIHTDKFIPKSRTAGGTVAVKVKPGSCITLP